MIDKFAIPIGEVPSEFVDRDRMRAVLREASLAMPASVRGWRSDLWRTSISGR